MQYLIQLKKPCFYVFYGQNYLKLFFEKVDIKLFMKIYKNLELPKKEVLHHCLTCLPAVLGLNPCMNCIIVYAAIIAKFVIDFYV